MSHPLNKIIDDAVEYVRADIFRRHDSFPGLESPIERILLAAIFAAVKYGSGFNTPFEDLVFHRVGDVEPARTDKPFFLYIRTQAPVLNYRADMLISAWDNEKYSEDGSSSFKRLVVECDGHDYHERTKDQAARDRSRDREMQAAGYTVFRFTGSEIYRDPCGCARQVIDWANKATFG